MKNNLENSFRESLENFEMPYNSAAWTSMSAKLDAKMPVKGSHAKWYIAAGIILVASLTSSLFFFNNENHTEKTTLAETTEQNSTSIKNENNTPEVKSTTPSVTSENEIQNNSSTKKDEATKDSGEKSGEMKSSETTSVDKGNESPSIKETTHQPTKSNTKDSKNPTQENNTKQAITPENLIIPSISSVCVGDKIEVQNVNDLEIVIGGPWFSQIIEPHSTATITFKNEGTYVIGPEDADDGKNLKTFTVNELPNIDFSIEKDAKYKDGLPTIKLTSHTEGEVTWDYGNVTSRGGQITPHFFQKGNHPVKITITGENGCSNSLEKNVYIEETYNLMAVNSFIPNDNDIRRSTFMPYALTQRKDVQFNLIILDPTDGHTVYQTNDVTAGWPGIDQQTGQQVKYEKAYIWKVIISNPVKGEKGEYAGTITPLTR